MLRQSATITIFRRSRATPQTFALSMFTQKISIRFAVLIL
jgi:hypothetical protein